MKIDSERSDSVSPEDIRTLLAERLLKAVGKSPSRPLSSAQQRLWFLDQLTPNTPLYNVPSVARLKGPLDLAALEKALNAIVARHETLRTRFVSEDGEPAQIIDEGATIQLEQHDLESLPESRREEESARLVRAEVTRPFNLSSDRLLRAVVLRIGPCEHVLILNMHHIVSDEWSFKTLYHELQTFYTAFQSGGSADLPALPIQYRDYAAWQREWLKSAECEKQLQFWKERLRGDPPGVDLPTDHPRQPGAASSGQVQTRSLGEDLTEGLRQLAREEGATLFMVLLAAFKVLLYRYTKQEDIIVGSPMAGRNRVETEDLIGFFVNTVPLRTKLSGEMTFQQVLAEVKEVALTAYSHQELPFEKLVEALHPERSLTGTPFVKVLFLHQTGMEAVKLPGLEVEFLDVTTGTAKFDISLGVAELGASLMTGIEYNADLFESATATRFLQHYESLLQGIVAQRAQKISALPLLSEMERRELLGEWTPAKVEFPEGECLHEWFETQVSRSPEATAVVFGQQRLTYRELNEQANQLAHYLKRAGVRPEVSVVLHLERSLDLPVAILAVLKAGGVYVPTDPSWPRDRLGFMLSDTEAPLIVTREKLRGNLSQSTARVVCLDRDAEAIQKEARANPPNVVNREHGAYIIYTSGSTGRPKGVIVTHHNVARLMKQTEGWYGFNSNDVWTLFHSYTFDFSVWELWGALLYGGRLVVVPYLVSRSPAEFYTLLAEEKVTVLNQTPSAFRQLIWAEETARAPLPLNLRYVIFGGEALELQSLKKWFERHGDEKPLLVNMYGITETTVHVTYRVIRQQDLSSGVGSVIGVPIPDLRVYLLDEKLQPVPAGVSGEICVAGKGVARGYLNRPELTKERFIDDPFSAEPGARLYRSGDLARHTAQGDLEYLGRMDNQVKIRGFRVELGEIESVLNSHPLIRESVVTATDGPDGSKRLIAYIIPNGTAPTTADVRDHIGQKIPEYMVPSLFVPMESLPLTANGKVDHRRLPAPDHDQTATGEACVLPRNDTEATLVEIWCQLLRRKPVSIHQNFFHLGGHSLLATQAIWRIADAFNVELPVRAIFQSPTIAELAELVRDAQPGNAEGIVRRASGGEASKLVERLGQLSDAELGELLQQPGAVEQP